MKISRNNQTKTHSNSKTCVVQEYALQDEHMDMAVATLSGRYPEEKRVVNQECRELAYVLEGDGKVVVEGETVALTTGDVILIEAGEKYYWEGHMKLVISCQPAWHPEQHQLTD